LSKTLMVLNGNKWISNTWKQELTIKDDGVYGEILITGRRTQMFLPYDRIAQVNVMRQMFTSDIEIVNKGGSGNILIKALNKDEAEHASQLINKLIRETSLSANKTISEPSADIPSQIKKLAELKESGIISETEFENKKMELLARM
jgi:hypothetical protein